MRPSPYLRIQWFHDETSRRSYPNAARLSERFQISVRQAQRDITYLRDELGAPLRYDPSRQGYIYTDLFSLPLVVVSENDRSLAHIRESDFSAPAGDHDLRDLPDADNVIIQSQIPYTAILNIPDRLTVLELRSYIRSEETSHDYLCEFHNIDRFLCAILTARSAIRIVEPDWLRDKLVLLAERAIESNK